jgi:pimeloyl-ACP methyl ester carboxylesterase
VVKHGLLNANSYPASASVTAQLKDEFDIKRREFCDTKLGCYDYYFAANKAGKQKLSINNKAHFTDKPYSTSLTVNRDDVPSFKGSVVLVHGFRGSKDWSLMSAAYFQFLGFDVYIFDLLGHGELATTKGFGVADTQYIQRFIESQLDSSDPIIAVGYSMGGLVATSLLNQNTVGGAILQAPMTRFDDALLGYFKDRAPWYSVFLSDSTIRNGANSALKEVGLSAQDTNTISLLETSTSPLLVFSSTVDSVAPHPTFAALKNTHINVIKVDDVEHAYMSMIGQAEHTEILLWLGEYFGE